MCDCCARLTTTAAAAADTHTYTHTHSLTNAHADEIRGRRVGRAALRRERRCERRRRPCVRVAVVDVASCGVAFASRLCVPTRRRPAPADQCRLSPPVVWAERRPAPVRPDSRVTDVRRRPEILSRPPPTSPPLVYRCACSCPCL